MWYTVNSNKIKAKRKTTMKKINKKNLLINGAISVGVAAAGVVAVLPKNNAQAEQSIDQLDKEISNSKSFRLRLKIMKIAFRETGMRLVLFWQQCLLMTI